MTAVAVRAVETHCPYCAMQCGMNLVVDAAGGVEVEARSFPVNRGGLCQKGWTAAALLRHEERLRTPLMRPRRGGPLRPVTWDDALDRIVAGERRCQGDHGRAAVGVFGGGGLTNEKAYALGKFARVALGIFEEGSSAGLVRRLAPPAPPQWKGMKTVSGRMSRVTRARPTARLRRCAAILDRRPRSRARARDRRAAR
jgi:anaerobic selenocysteine-containing dehydrogenase